MDIESLEKFVKKIGNNMSHALLERYDSSDFDIDTQKIEKEIYEVALCYSRVFFFESNDYMEESVKNNVKDDLLSRYDSRSVKKMSDVELIAHWIKLEAIRTLESQDIFLL
jgi:hypothetical protein